MDKRDYSGKKIAGIALVSIGMIVLAVFLNRFFPVKKGNDNAGTEIPSATDAPKPSASAPAPAAPPSEPTADPSEKIATFLQGPQSWGKRLTWSGEWGEEYYDGGKFGGFGCGLCCMANIYVSCTPYKCSPVDMYYYAKKVTGYGGGGAIDWGFMKRALNKAGFACVVGNKPESYELFQSIVKNSLAMIAVVSSNNSTCYWKDTPGHYVTLFLYDAKKDTVFLGDSGDPAHNRQRIPLKKIYRSLKTENRHQYLQVLAYKKSSDSWKHNSYSGVCVLPDGWE